MSSNYPRPESIRPSRPRGFYIPTDEVSAHLANGWSVMDDCPGRDECLLAPPEAREGEAV